MAKKPKEKKEKKAKDEKPKKLKKAKAREEEDDIEEEEEYSPEAAGKPKLDIYVGLSALTLIALIGAAVFFYLDVEWAKTKQLPGVNLTLGGLKPGTAQPARPNANPIPIPNPIPNP